MGSFGMKRPKGEGAALSRLLGVLVPLLAAGCAGPLEKALPGTAPAPVRTAAEACDKGDANGCYTLGAFYWSEPGLRGAERRDIAAAVPVLRMACDGGQTDACNLSEEVKVGADAHESLIAAARACDGGDAGACVVMGRAWYRGDGVSLDVPHAVELFADACSQGVSAGCDGSEQTRLRTNASEGVRRVAAGCDMQDRASCRRLGDLYRAGTDVPASPDGWVRTRARACRFGDHDACAEVGAALLAGGEFTRNADLAVELLGIGCSAGHMPSCEPSEEIALGTGSSEERLGAARGCDRGDAGQCDALGVMYREGEHGRRNPERAAAAFEKGCGGGSASACMNLAGLRASGLGGQQDQVEAARLFAQACEGDALEACFQLGNAYRSGTGVPRNIELAFRYWNRACDGGLQRACDEMPGQFEAILPANAPDSVRVMARGCDSGQYLRCLELANAWLLGQGVPRNIPVANRLATVACFNGIEPSCQLVQFPGPCRVDDVDTNGQVRNSQSFTYDMAQLRRTGEIAPENQPPPARPGEVAVIVPTAPPGGELPEADARAAWTWPAASRQSFYAAGHTVRSDESTRNVVVTNPEGVNVDMTFDASGRLSTLVEIAGARRLEASYRFDATGRLVEITRREGTANTTTLFDYDAQRRLATVRRTTRDGDSYSELLRTFGYDNRNNLTEMIVDTQATRPGAREMEQTRRQTRIIRDNAGNPMRRDLRDANRTVLEATNYDYGCFAR